MQAKVLLGSLVIIISPILGFWIVHILRAILKIIIPEHNWEAMYKQALTQALRLTKGSMFIYSYLIEIKGFFANYSNPFIIYRNSQAAVAINQYKSKMLSKPSHAGARISTH